VEGRRGREEKEVRGGKGDCWAVAMKRPPEWEEERGGRGSAQEERGENVRDSQELD
jgi:hypothetical protein